ncbi:lamin-like protein [Fagus crenata]
MVAMMEGPSLKKIIVSMLIVMMMVELTKAKLHYVGGGKNRWATNVNFSEWTSHEQFNVGDWLYFGFDKLRYNVFEVNETSYEKCIATDFIKNITKGGRDVFQLTEAKPYYFICSYYCFQGMKVAINVQDIPTPAPAPNKNGSPSNHSIQVTPFMELAIAMVWTFLFKLY